MSDEPEGGDDHCEAVVGQALAGQLVQHLGVVEERRGGWGGGVRVRRGELEGRRQRVNAWEGG